MNLRDRSWDAELLGPVRACPLAILPRDRAVLRALRDGEQAWNRCSTEPPSLAVHRATPTRPCSLTAPGPGERQGDLRHRVLGHGRLRARLRGAERAVPARWRGRATGPTYALEGNIRSSGATVAWLARTLGRTPAELAELARTSRTATASTLVPAFNGLGAPWWDPDAVGLITGLTLGTQPAHIARASLESVAHQVEDVLAAMAPATGRLDDAARRRGCIVERRPHAASGRHQRSAGPRRTLARTCRRSAPPTSAGIGCGLWTDDGLAASREPGPPRAALDGRARLGVRKSWKTALVRARAPVEA